MRIAITCVAVLLGLTSLVALGQDGPSSATPPTAPTTRPRREAVIPPGFKKIEGEGRMALVEPADEAWAQERLSAMKPAALPPGLAALIDKATQQRDTLVKQISTDLALPDTNTIAAAYDKNVIEQLKQLGQLRPPIYYLVATNDRIKQLLLAGWEDPNFYYNRAMDGVVHRNAVGIRPDGPADDSVIGALYAPNASPADRAKALSDTIARTEADYNNFIDTRAKSVIGAGLATTIHDLAIAPLELKDDQRWLGLGTEIVFASRYAGPLTEQPDLLKSMAADNPQNPLRFSAIDLLHPMDFNQMVPEAVPFYIDTSRRKSAAAVEKLLGQGGQDAVAKTLTAIRQNKPADGAALVKAIQEQTNVDLSNDLSH